MQLRAQPPGPVLVLAGAQQPDHRATDRAGQRVAAERRPVLARAQHAEYVAPANHGGDRYHAAAQSLAQDVQVGNDPLVLDGERVPGTAEPGLDLVSQEQHVP